MTPHVGRQLIIGSTLGTSSRLPELQLNKAMLYATLRDLLFPRITGRNVCRQSAQYESFEKVSLFSTATAETLQTGCVTLTGLRL